MPAQVYNLVPNTGEPALFGFSAVGSNVFLKSDVEWNGDYHEGFTIAVPEAPLGTLILQNRLVFTGNAGNGTFLTTPSTCNDPAQAAFAHTYSTFLRADSVEAPNPTFPSGSSRLEASLPPGIKPTGCNLVPFKPGIGVTPGTDQTDSPDGTTVEVTLPFEPAQPLANSDIRTARTSLPLGMGLNPSAANGLVACTDAQLGKGTRAPVACPPASKIGTVSVNTPPLPDGSVTGDVFLGKQLSRDPTSGQEYRIFVDAESARYGISARLIGNVSGRPEDRQADRDARRKPAGPVQLLQDPAQRRPQGAADQPADLRAQRIDLGDRPLHRHPAGQRRPANSPWRKRRAAAPARKPSARDRSRPGSRRARKATRPAPTAPSRSTSAAPTASRS